MMSEALGALSAYAQGTSATMMIAISQVKRNISYNLLIQQTIQII